MKKLLKVLDLFKSLLLLPYKLHRGQKKHAYQSVKRALLSMNLF